MTSQTAEKLLQRIGEAHPQPRLSAMERLVEILGDVHRCAPVIHITGTNGKSSTSRIIEALVRAHGLRTGLLTSPHLRELNERIVLDGEPISTERLDAAWAELEPIVSFVDDELVAAGEAPITFFEAVTALGFVAFADAPVDVMILEVGMGGTWDATNVASGKVAVFTPIDLDHTRQLGSSISEIARTKAGIIKQGATVVSARQSPYALAELQRAAAENNAELFVEDVDFALREITPAVGGQLLHLDGLQAPLSDLALPLLGDHQAQNAAVAITAVELFLARESGVNPDIIRGGLADVVSPGRFERISQSPTLYVDAAHNPHGMRALAETISLTFPEHGVGVLLGSLADKDVRGMAEPLGLVADTFFVTSPDSSRALDSHSCANLVRDVLPDAVVLERDDLADAVESLRNWVGESSDRIGVITGSVILVGEVMEYARSQRWS